MLRSFNDVTRFTVGTIGVPGERSFWIQIRSDNTLLSLAMEKGQVAAMADRLKAMLKEISNAHPLMPKPLSERDSLPLETPVVGDFQVGAIALFYDEESQQIQIDFREISQTGNLSGEDEDDDELLSIDSPLFDDIQIVRIFISTSQARGFSDRADLVVSAGRQPCPFCGFPINPDGHLCARANGYRR